MRAFLLAAFALEPPKTRLTFRIKDFLFKGVVLAWDVVQHLLHFALNPGPRRILLDTTGASAAYLF